MHMPADWGVSPLPLHESSPLPSDPRFASLPQAGSVEAAHAVEASLLGDATTGTIFTQVQQEPEIVMLETTLATPNDPSYRQQPHYTGSPVDMPAAWAVSTGSRDVVVAVTDSGMDMSHPDLEANK